MDIEVDGLEVIRSNQIILNNVYFKFEKSKTTGIFGRNGAGKSTFFDVIVGLVRPNNISMRVNGKYAKSIIQNNLLSYLSQGDCFPKYSKVSEISSIFDILPTKLNEICNQGKFKKDMKMAELSTGQRRLFEVLIFINSKHDFTILDEPFTGLMPIQIENVIEEIKDLKYRKGFIISDHQLKNHLEILDTSFMIKDRSSYILPMEDLKEQLEKYSYLPSGW